MEKYYSAGSWYTVTDPGFESGNGWDLGNIFWTRFEPIVALSVEAVGTPGDLTFRISWGPTDMYEPNNPDLHLVAEFDLRDFLADATFTDTHGIPGNTDEMWVIRLPAVDMPFPLYGTWAAISGRLGTNGAYKLGHYSAEITGTS